jgi:hypothetical protein
MRDDARANGPIFLTPSDLCERWQLSLRTLDKFDLPWTWLRPRVRRIKLSDVLAYEQRHRLTSHST